MFPGPGPGRGMPAGRGMGPMAGMMPPVAGGAVPYGSRPPPGCVVHLPPLFVERPTLTMCPILDSLVPRRSVPRLALEARRLVCRVDRRLALGGHRLGSPVARSRSSRCNLFISMQQNARATWPVLDPFNLREILFSCKTYALFLSKSSIATSAYRAL